MSPSRSTDWSVNRTTVSPCNSLPANGQIRFIIPCNRISELVLGKDLKQTLLIIHDDTEPNVFQFHHQRVQILGQLYYTLPLYSLCFTLSGASNSCWRKMVVVGRPSSLLRITNGWWGDPVENIIYYRYTSLLTLSQRSRLSKIFRVPGASPLLMMFTNCLYVAVQFRPLITQFRIFIVVPQRQQEA